MDSEYINTTKYCEELFAINASFVNPHQVITNYYTCDNSLIYEAETHPAVDFVNGQPVYFIKYIITFTIGTSKNPTDAFGIMPEIPTDSIDTICDKCIFNCDLFKYHPTEITYINCHNDGLSCISATNNLLAKKWCFSCHGHIMAHHLQCLIIDEINFNILPMTCIYKVIKTISRINMNDPIELELLKNFLQQDQLKINMINTKITNAKIRLDRITQTITSEIQVNQQKINNMLQTRGGTLEEYVNMINIINNL